MFTGLVEAAVAVAAWEPRGTGARLTLPLPAPGWEVAAGDSVAVSGACLTVVDPPGNTLTFDLSAETLARTWFARLSPGRIVNLERSLRLGDRLGGHLVSGHVDGIGAIEAIADPGDGGRLITFRVPPALERYLLDKGSVTLDGISLTVVNPRGGTFDVAVIPETLAATSLGGAEPGQPVHVEADQVGKWIDHLLKN
jgi:riboflavin synthase